MVTKAWHSTSLVLEGYLRPVTKPETKATDTGERPAERFGVFASFVQSYHNVFVAIFKRGYLCNG